MLVGCGSHPTSTSYYYHHNMLLFRNHPQHPDLLRPFKTTDEMHRLLKHRHNEVVGPNDTVYHLGDFAYGPGAKSWQQIQSLLHGLNGKHHLILGNHDHIEPFKYLEAGFLSVHTSLHVNDWLLIHDPAVAGVYTTQPVIHGHTHSLGKRLAPNTFCVCVELWDYYPVPLSKIREEFGDA